MGYGVNTWSSDKNNWGRPTEPVAPKTVGVEEAVVYEEVSKDRRSFSFFGQLNHVSFPPLTPTRASVGDIMPCGHPSVITHLAILTVDRGSVCPSKAIMQSSRALGPHSILAPVGLLPSPPPLCIQERHVLGRPPGNHPPGPLTTVLPKL